VTSLVQLSSREYDAKLFFSFLDTIFSINNIATHVLIRFVHLYLCKKFRSNFAY